MTVAATTGYLRTVAFRPLHSPLRWLLASAAVIVAAAHVPVIAPHLEEAPYMGALFVVLTVGCGTIGLTALIRDPAGLYVLATVPCGLAVVGYAATRLIAFPMLADDVGNWLEPLGIVSVLGELTVVATAILALRQGATFPRRPQDRVRADAMAPGEP
jgi:protein-S-isoprenylcysteine O-methyltransferase Ste14